MRISFDVDDTLVCDATVPCESLVPWWKRWWYPEPLRQGTRELMREMLRRRHALWIYTTSSRPLRYLRRWFAGLGIPLEGVVNQERHQLVVGRHGPSKYPPAFSIDLHIDDSLGVAEEGRRHGFAVHVVSPADLDWTSGVLAAIGKRERGSMP
jgi:hypothetical protein